MENPFNLPVICPIIIGRTSELTTLRLLIEQAKSEKGHVALISGEAGLANRVWLARQKPMPPLTISCSGRGIASHLICFSYFLIWSHRHLIALRCSTSPPPVHLP